ncbi:PWWP domain-containing protein MUM1, partial [Apaloderma vittatum]
MTDQEYVLCRWRKRLWPAKVLCRTGAAGKTSVANREENYFKVEILGLKEQVRVKGADALLLKEEHIENIASNLDQRTDSTKAVEELKYRHSLKIALDILTQNVSGRQVPPSEKGPNTRLSQHNSHYFSEPRTSRKKRSQKTNPSLKTDTKKQSEKGSLVLESAKMHESGTSPSSCRTEGLSETLNSESQNCEIPESKSLPRQKKDKPRLFTKSQLGNKVSCKPKEERSKQGRKIWGGAGSPEPRQSELLEGRAQPPAEEGSPPSGPVRKVRGRSQPRRILFNSSYKSSSDDLEKSISSEGESLVKQLGGRKKPSRFKRVNGEQERGAGASPGSKRKRGSCPEPSPVPSSSRLESPDLSSKSVFTDSLSRLSALVDEEEEDEELPSVLSHQEPQSIEEGILVWCKLRRYPYWPAVVKNVRRKQRKACVLLIEESMNEKKKGFSVPLRSLKHFDCEEKPDLIEQAKEGYRHEIEWCIRLISDYRIRLGCHSFTGSFLEYFAADISYPVRKEGFIKMTFPNEAEEDVEESPSETSPQKPSKKLLPDRTRAARDKANKKIVEFIVKTKGAEEHLLAILKSRKQSRWLKEFLKQSQYVTCVETYLEDEEQLDLVVNYLKEVYYGTDAKSRSQINRDGIKFISEVLLPEAIIYAISAVDDIDYKKAEEKYIKGPTVSKREREIFDEEILARAKRKIQLASADS